MAGCLFPCAFQSRSTVFGKLPERSGISKVAAGGKRTQLRISRWRTLMKGFLIGLGMGVGLGVLFAPMSGEETRNNLVDRASDLSDSARELVDQGKERVRSGISAVRGQAQNAIGRAQQATGTEGNV